LKRFRRIQFGLAGLVAMLGIISGAGVVAHAAGPRDDLHALLPDRIKQSGVLTIATDAHHPPNESYADDGKTVVGFEPDVWNTLATLLGVTTRVVSIDFDGLIPGVQSGRFDVAFESLSDDTAREQQVTFIDYANASAVVYAPASTAAVSTDPSSLCGLKAGLQAGTDFATSIRRLSAACTAHGKPAIDAMEYASDAATVMALYAQRVDFAVDDRLAAKKMTEHSPRPLKIVDVGLPRFTVGAIVRHDDKQLAAALLAALERMHQDGSYAAILSRWQVSPLALDHPGLNLAAGRP
jgi:polar amino acid transport system substrate-binding protein